MNEKTPGAAIVAQLARYGLVGGIVYASDVLLFAVLFYLIPETYLLDNAAAKGLGALVGFVLHRSFTFAGDHQDGAGRQLLKYTGLWMANLALANSLLFISVDRLEAPELPSKIVVDVIVIGVSFIVSKFFIFKHQTGDDHDQHQA